MLRFALVSAAILACSAGPADPQLPPPPPPPPAGQVVRLLFIGNSLTYTNDLPGIVRDLTTAAGRYTPVIAAATAANYALEDHWSGGSARTDLRSQPFDYVIMQQGPSTLAESGVQLRQWSMTWSDEIRKYGARPALYVVWPPRGGNLDAGIANYEAAANAANAAIFPVGEAWREAWLVDPTMPLYGDDAFHPGIHGTWLAALVITAMVHDQPVGDFPNLFPTRISEEQAVVLRNAATKAIQRYGRR